MGNQALTTRQPYGRTFLIVFCVVMAIAYLTDKARNASQVQPVLNVKPDSPSSLSISTLVISTECKDSKTIDFSLVEMRINGGEPPYELMITNSKFQTVGPFKVTENDKPIPIKIYGGDYFSAKVHSSDNKEWSANVSLPNEAEICQHIETATLPPSATPVPSDTPPPTNTEVIPPTATPIPSEITPIEMTALTVEDPEPGKTKTPRPSQAAYTPDPEASKTPIPVPSNTTRQPSTTTSVPQQTNTPNPQSTNTTVSQATNTPRPQNTNTPVAQPTNTPIPQPTSTPRPQYSNTPQPTLTPTPIIPNPHECEDGKDNDDDGYIDYPADPQCNKPSDQHENK